MLTLIYPNRPPFTAPLFGLKGVGPKTMARLAALGFHNTGDLLTHSPKYYQDRRKPKNICELARDEEALIAAAIISARSKFSARTRRHYQEAEVSDQNGDRLILTWFNLPPYYFKNFTRGRRLRVFGRACLSERGWSMAHPDVEFTDEEDAEGASFRPEIRPVYGPIGELGPGLVKKLMDQALALLSGCENIMPPAWLEKHKLSDPIASLRILHSPPGGIRGSLPRPQESRAFQNLALFELFFWRLMMISARACAPVTSRDGAEKGPPEWKNSGARCRLNPARNKGG